MKKIKIACIGAGYFSRFHIEAWKRIPEVDLVAICDKNAQKAQALAQEFVVGKNYTEVNKLFAEEQVDIVDIITPPETHLDLCKKTVDAGKHIICQKPLAPTFAEAQKIVSLTTEANIRFMVHENFRFQPWYRKIKSLLNDGAIGDRLHTLNLRMRTGDGWGNRAYLDRQPYFQTMPRLFIYETGIHFIDVFRFLGGEVSSVYAKLRKLNPVIAGEDCGLVLFDFKKGGQGILDGNRYNESNHKNPRYTFGETVIEGNGGTIRLNLDGTIKIQQLGQEERTIQYHHEDRGFAGDCVYYTQRHFVDAFLQNDVFETNGKDYLKNLIIQEAIYKSNEQGKAIRI